MHTSKNYSQEIINIKIEEKQGNVTHTNTGTIPYVQTS